MKWAILVGAFFVAAVMSFALCAHFVNRAPPR
jgi:hypothetical protein